MQRCPFEADFVNMEITAGTEDLNLGVVIDVMEPLKLKESVAQASHGSDHLNQDDKCVDTPAELAAQSVNNFENNENNEPEPSSSLVQKCLDQKHETTASPIKNIIEGCADVQTGDSMEGSGQNVPLDLNGCEEESSMDCSVPQEKNIVALECGDPTLADDLSVSKENSQTISSVGECNEDIQPIEHQTVNCGDLTHVTDGVSEVSIVESNDGTTEAEVKEDTSSLDHESDMVENDEEKLTPGSQESSKNHVKKKPKKLESILSNLKSKTLTSQTSPLVEEVENPPQEVEPIPELPPGTVVVTPSDVGIAHKVRRKKHRKIKKHDLPLNKHKLEGMINAATDIKDLCGVTEGIIDPSVVEGVDHRSNVNSVEGVNGVSPVASDSLASTLSVLASSSPVGSLQQSNPAQPTNQLSHPVAVPQNVSVVPSQTQAHPGLGGVNTMPVSQPLLLGVTQNGNSFVNQSQLGNLAVLNSASSQLQLLQRQQVLQQADQYQSTIPSQPGGQHLIVQSQMQPQGAQIIVQGQPQQVIYNQHQGIGQPTYQVAPNNPPHMSNQLQAPILTSHLQQTKFHNQFQNPPVQQYHSPGATPVLSSSPQLVNHPRLMVPPQQMGQLSVQPMHQQQQAASPVFQVTPQSTPAQPKSQPVFVLQRGDTLKLDASGNLVVVARESVTNDPKPTANSLPVSQQQSVVQSAPPPLTRPPPLQQLPQLSVRAPATTASSSLPIGSSIIPGESVNSSPLPTSSSVSMPPLQPISQLSSRLNAPVIPSVSVTATTTVTVASSTSQSPVTTAQTQPQGILAQALQAPQSAYVDSASGLHLAASGLVQQKNLPSNQGQALLAKLQQPHVMQAISKAAMGAPNQVHVPAGSSAKQPSRQVKIVYRSALVAANQAKSNTQANQPKKVTLFSCSICTKIFLHKETFEQHTMTHYTNQTCPNCKKVFTDLPKHRREGCYRRVSDNVRYGSYSYQCSYCNLRFRDTTQLEGHTRKDHPGKILKDLKSVLLSNESVNVNKAKVHDPKTNGTTATATPEVPSVKCDDKGNTPPVKVMAVVSDKTIGQYRKEVKVETIVKDKHESPPPKSVKDDLWAPRSHKKSKRPKKKNHPKSLLKDTPEPGYPKKAKVSSCDEWYGSILIQKDPECTTSKLISKYGERKKSGKRPFHCKLCPKDFFSEHCLFEHIKIHTKPFTCGACGLRNARKDNIMKHIQLVHQGPKYRTRDKRKREYSRERKGRKRMKTLEEGENVSDSENESDEDANKEEEEVKNGNVDVGSDTELPTMVQQNSRLARLRRRSQLTGSQDEAQTEPVKEEQEEDAIEQITDLSPDRNGDGDGNVAVEKIDDDNNDDVSEVTNMKNVCEENDAKIKSNADIEIVDDDNSSKGMQDLSGVSEHAMSPSHESTDAATNEPIPVSDVTTQADCKENDKSEGSVENKVEAADVMEVDSVKEVPSENIEGNINLSSSGDGLEVTEAVFECISDQEKQVADQGIDEDTDTEATRRLQKPPSERLTTQSLECSPQPELCSQESISIASDKSDENDAIEAIDSRVLEAKIEEDHHGRQDERDENNKGSSVIDLEAGKLQEEVQADDEDVKIMESTAITK